MPARSASRLHRLALLVSAALAIVTAGATATLQPVDRAAERWVAQTLKRLTIDEKIGQMLVPSFEAMFVSTDSDEFDRLARLVRDSHVGGIHVFGGRQRAPSVLLNPTYGTVTLGEPFAAASLINRLQGLASVPLLNTADFEAGVGFRLAGATVFPRLMAFGAAGDERLAFEAGRITAREARALGVHVNFAPVVDVNNNPRNPVINTRSFGEDPAQVGALGGAYVRGLENGGMIATLKHFPGHGDTDTDTHLGLATITHTRDRLERVEWAPFRAGIAAGAGAIMTSHIETQAIDPDPGTPATFSPKVVGGLLRQEFRFGGLVYTDSMSMNAIARANAPGDAAVRALKAGHDVVLHSPDDLAALRGVKTAVERGELEMSRIDASVARVLRAKAQMGLQTRKTVDLEAVAASVGTRANQAVAREVSERSITLVKDERGQVPLRIPKESTVLYLSVLDYPSGWEIAAPSRSFIPELRSRWPSLTSIELSDRTSASELEVVRASLPRYDAVIASVFVRTAAYSGRMDLAAPLVTLLKDLARSTATTRKPFVTVLFGNPYTATFLADLPAMLLTYDYYDQAEISAVRALAGDTAIGGRLPIGLPGVAVIGSGLDRPAQPATAAR